MAGHAKQPEFTGIQNNPGIVAIIVTILITSVFVGALYNVAMNSSHGHGDHAGGAEHAEGAEDAH